MKRGPLTRMDRLIIYTASTKSLSSTPEVVHTGAEASLHVGDREALEGMVGGQGAVHSREGRPHRPGEVLHREPGVRRKKGVPHRVAGQGEPAVTGTEAVQAWMVVLARSRWEAGRLGRGRARNPWVAAWAAAVVKAMGAPRCQKALQALADL